MELLDDGIRDASTSYGPRKPSLFLGDKKWPPGSEWSNYGRRRRRRRMSPPSNWTATTTTASGASLSSSSSSYCYYWQPPSGDPNTEVGDTTKSTMGEFQSHHSHLPPHVIFSSSSLLPQLHPSPFRINQVITPPHLFNSYLIIKYLGLIFETGTRLMLSSPH